MIQRKAHRECSQAAANAVCTYAARLHAPISASVRFVPGSRGDDGAVTDGVGGKAVGGELLIVLGYIAGSRSP